MKPFACLLLTFCFLSPYSIAKDKEPIIESRDVVYQTTWFTPRDRKAVNINAGLLHMDTYSWRVYSVVGKSFSGTERHAKLVVEMTGPVSFSYAGLVLTVDGKVAELPPQQWTFYEAFYERLVHTLSLDVPEDFIRGMGSAREVYVAIPLQGQRYGVRLSDEQLSVFKMMADKYDSLGK